MAYTMRAAGAAIAFGYGAARVIPAPVCVDASDTDTKICAQTGEPRAGSCADPLRDASTGVYGERKTPATRELLAA